MKWENFASFEFSTWSFLIIIPRNFFRSFIIFLQESSLLIVNKLIFFAFLLVFFKIKLTYTYLNYKK
jgi:hypothetical protein